MKGALAIFAVGFFFFLASSAASAESEIRYFQDEQVPIGSAAVRVERGFLIHSASHTGETLEAAMEDLENSAPDATMVKLHICIAPGTVSRRDIAKVISARWPENPPAVTVVETSGSAPVSVDAVWHSDESKNENLTPADGVLSPDKDILQLSGRAASGELAEATTGTMEQLFEVLKGLGADRESIVQIKAFLQPIEKRDIAEEKIVETFGDLPVPPIVFAQWTSASRFTEIELIAEAPGAEKNDDTTSYHTPPGDKPSPVFSRVARIHGDEVIYLGGIAGTTNSTPTEEVETLYEGMKRIATAAGTDLRHLAKATYYVSEDGASAALNELRPGLYDPERPPAASKIQVPGVGMTDRGILIDMIAAPSE